MIPFDGPIFDELTLKFRAMGPPQTLFEFLPNPFGLYDTLGNVWEWCADIWTDDLKTLPRDGSSNTTGDSSRRPVRGGSWDVIPWSVRAAYRGGDDSGLRSSNTGFRVARTSLTS